MLTATYSQIAMATEQKKACHFLLAMRQANAAFWDNLQEADLCRLEAALAGLWQFDRYCHERKMEKYVIPTVRGASREIDAIVGDLDALSGAGIDWLRTAAEQMRLLFESRSPQLRHLCSAMEAYCDCLQQRLRREDEELLPIVWRVLSVDDWFMLAAKFLGDERPLPRQGSAARKPAQENAPVS